MGGFYNGSYVNRVGSCGIDACDSEQGQAVGFREHGNENSVSIKCREFLDKLSNY